MTTIQRIDPRGQLPKKVEQVKHWLDLLSLRYIILSDLEDGTYTFLLTLKNCPDINISLENEYSHITFFSNGLTSLVETDEDVIHEFLLQVLRIQARYFTSRVIVTGEKDYLRIFLGYRFDEMSMYRFSRKIRELIDFVRDIAKLLDEFKMHEIWRDIEQEPKYPEINVDDRVRFI
ncbi:MAG: hypothetical protein ACTSW1_14395 [Candidatus Hodarchaeales archaeon]